MASTFSTNLKIELMATGENSGTWGTVTNTNLGTALEQAIVGYGNPSYSSDANLTISLTDSNAAQAARALVLNVTSSVSLTATRELVVPTIQKQYIVQNNTTGSQSITVKTSAGTGITVPSGRKAHLYVDGTNVIFMDDYVDINGGTIDNVTIGGSTPAAGNFTTVDTTNLEVTNIKAKDGTAAASIADSTGVVSITANPILSGGTANGVAYLNGSKVLTTGSALVFDGTNLGLGAAPVAVGSSPVLEIYSGANNGILKFTNSTTGTTNSDGTWLYQPAGGNNFIVQNQESAGDLRLYSTAHIWGNHNYSTEYMRLTSTGLGIGTSSPALPLHVYNSGAALAYFESTNANGPYVIWRSSGTSIGDVGSGKGISGSGNATDFMIASRSTYPLLFGTGSTERARITSGGYFKASDDGVYAGSANTWHEFNQSANSIGLAVVADNASLTSTVVEISAARNTSNNTYYFLDCAVSGVAYRFRVADSGNVTNTNGSYGTISDAKMKADIVDAGSQWNDIKAVRFRKFKMKDDPDQVVQLGVVAQELEQTSPGLVEEHTDRDTEGNDIGTTTKSVKTSVLLMKAAVALQEAMARIEALEAKVTALESKGA